MSRVVHWITKWPPERLVRVACVLGIGALLMMMWSVLVPSALPVVLGMSVGQGLGALAFVLYLVAVLGDLWRGGAPTQDEDGADSSATDE